MSDFINLNIVSPDGVGLAGMAESIRLPAQAGEMEVLYAHEPYIVNLEAGEIKVSGFKSDPTGAQGRVEQGGATKATSKNNPSNLNAANSSNTANPAATSEEGNTTATAHSTAANSMTANSTAAGAASLVGGKDADCRTISITGGTARISADRCLLLIEQN